MATATAQARLLQQTIKFVKPEGASGKNTSRRSMSDTQEVAFPFVLRYKTTVLLEFIS